MAGLRRSTSPWDKLIAYLVACTAGAVAVAARFPLPLGIVALGWGSLALPPLVYRIGQGRFTSFVGLRYLRDDRRSAALWFFLLLGLNLLVMGVGLSTVFHARVAMFILLAAVVILFVCGVAAFLTVYTTISIVGVTFGVASLVLVLSVMSGFEGDLRDKILGANAHVVVRARTGDMAAWPEAMRLVGGVKGVVGVTPILENEVMIVSPTNPAGALLKGIDLATLGDVVELPDKIEEGSLSYLEHPEKLLTLPAGPYDDAPRIVPGPDADPESGPASAPASGPAKAPETLPGAPLPKKGSATELFDSLARNDPSGSEASGLLYPDGPEGRSGFGESGPARPRRVLPGIVVGKELARTLRVYVGDEVSVISPSADLGPTGPIPKKRSFRVAAVFYTGMYEFDTKYAYILLPVAQKFFNMGDAVTGIEARVAEAGNAPEVADAIRVAFAHWDGSAEAAARSDAAAPVTGAAAGTAATAAAGATAPDATVAFDPLAWEEAHGGATAAAKGSPSPNLVDSIATSGSGEAALAGDIEVLDWQQMNRGLFSALRLEKTAMFIILVFIVLVAAFNIVSTLVMVVLEKGREIAILKSMGTSPREIIRIFVTQGLAIGLLGTAWGVTIGFAGCVYMNTVGILLDPDVYYISSLPVRADVAEFAVVGLAAIGISVLATIYPAWQASRLNPVDGLRYE